MFPTSAKRQAQAQAKAEAEASPTPRPIRKRREKGLFEDGVWKCNCDPRKEAVDLQVAKKGPNKGRWFWTCAHPKDHPDKCNFFMWDSDAEAHAQIANPPPLSPMPVPAAPRTPSKPRPTPTKRQQPTPSTATPNTRKRSRDTLGPFFSARRTPSLQRVSGWLLRDNFQAPFQGEEEEEVEEDDDDEAFATAPLSPSRNVSPTKARRTPFQTSPSKAASGKYPPLGTSFVSDADTVPDDDIFVCPRTVPRGRRSGIFDPSTTGLSPQKLALPLVQEVLELLGNDEETVVRESTLSDLADVLAVHVKRYDGVVLGRDATRKVVLEKDAEIEDLKEVARKVVDEKDAEIEGLKEKISMLQEEKALAEWALEQAEKQAEKQSSVTTVGSGFGLGNLNVQSTQSSQVRSTQGSTLFP